MRTSDLIAAPLLALAVGLACAATAQEAGRLPMVAVQVETEVLPPAPEGRAAGAETIGGASTTATAPPVVDTPEQPALEALRWIARPVVVFADSDNDPRFRQQMDMLDQYTEDLSARDVVILTDTDPGTLSPLRRELRPQDFMLVLIDKDGSVVQRRPTPTTVRELTHTIDRLPSRRQETDSLRQ